MSSSHVFDFTDVFRAEIAVINARRASQMLAVRWFGIGAGRVSV